jgi:phage head maturation protease
VNPAALDPGIPGRREKETARMRFYWPIAKVDGERRMVWGYASTEAEDDQGETVTREALAAALDDYMRFANIREMHQPSAVGVAKEAAVDDKGLYLGAKIVDPDAWAKVVEGVYKGFSIGGRVTARDAADRRLITGLRLTEISVVDRPANPEAVFDCWKRATAGEPEPAGAAKEPPDPVEYADPGFQPDGRTRYPLDTERHIRAAWTYIHQPHNAGRYTTAQLAQVKARIVAAWRARIEPAGPPAAARKSLAATARLAQIILALDGLCDATGEAAKADAAPPAARLQQIIGELCDLLAALVAEEEGEPDGDGAAAPVLAAMAAAGALRKARRPDPLAIAGELARFAQDIVPRLEALRKRVDEIASTPLPPQTAARGLSAIAKREDGGSIAAGEDVVATLARMSEEERTLTLIKVAHANPIAPFGRLR